MFKVVLGAVAAISIATSASSYINAMPQPIKHESLEDATAQWKEEPDVSNLTRSIYINNIRKTQAKTTSPFGLSAKTDTGTLQAYYDTTPGTLGRKGRLVITSKPGQKICQAFHGNALNKDDVLPHHAETPYDITGHKEQNWTVDFYDYASCAMTTVTFVATN